MGCSPADEIILACTRAAARGYMGGADGNASVRLGEGRMLITPSGVAKDRLEPRMLATMTLDGELIAGPEPSSEWQVHAWAYKTLPEAGAVLHTHAPVLTALSLRGLMPAWAELGELAGAVEKVGAVGRLAPGSQELAMAVAEQLGAGARVVVMAGHGVVSVGKDMEQAWIAMDKAEHAAAILERAGALVPLEPGAGAGLAQRLRVDRLPLTPQWLEEKRWEDQRGEIHLVLGQGLVRSLGVIEIRPGSPPRGQHYHELAWEGLYVVKGRVRCVVECVESRERMELMLVPGSRVWIPPRVAHALVAITRSWLVEFSDQPAQAKATRAWRVMDGCAGAEE